MSVCICVYFFRQTNKLKLKTETFTFEYFQIFTCFRVVFDLTQFNRHKLWCLPKCVPFNYLSLSYIILALTFAVILIYQA